MSDNDPTIEAIARELAASDDPIQAVGVDARVTLRQAIHGIFWKAQSLFNLRDRPVSPTKADDQFGHVMSMRAEVLINQAILQAIAQKSGIDVDAIRANVMRSLST